VEVKQGCSICCFVGGKIFGLEISEPRGCLGVGRGGCWVWWGVRSGGVVYEYRLLR